MIRLFNVYYPIRTLVLFGVETLAVCASFLLAVLIQFRQDSFLVLNYEGGYVKVLLATGLAIACFYGFDLYELHRFHFRWEAYVQLLFGLGVLALLLAGLGFLVPGVMLGNNAFLMGLSIATAALLAWRTLYDWLVRQPFLRERVYVLGAGERAQRLVETLREHTDLGMEVVGWAGALGNGSLTREEMGRMLQGLSKNHSLDRVIVALQDRRGTLPVRELLDLRMSGVKVEEATALLEKTSGKIEVEDLHPSNLIFSEGFRLNPYFLYVRRVISVLVSLTALILCLPLLPLLVLAVRLSSPGPILYRQKRVGRDGVVFDCYKFRTMRADAEADTGPTWASDDDPRITAIGRLLRRTRLDEIPQLWNVLRGDMGFVGPRPERPEFVERLSRELPYYHLRHILRPGITGWAQIRYRYGNTVEDAKEKLRYELYYVKHLSLGLDVLIMLHTLKIVLLGRGAK